MAGEKSARMFALSLNDGNSVERVLPVPKPVNFHRVRR
jgi:hypothetical protein